MSKRGGANLPLNEFESRSAKTLFLVLLMVNDMLFTNAHIVSMDGSDIPKGYLQVLDGKITALGEMPPALNFHDSDTVDCHGDFIYPGFIDAHCHIGMFGDGAGFESEDANEDNDPCTPHLRALDGCNPLDRCFSDALEWGVTTVVTGPGSGNPIAGQIIAMKTMGKRIDDMVVASPVGMKFSMGENPKYLHHSKSQSPSTRMTIAAIIREQLRKTQKYIEAYDIFESIEDAEEPDYDARCEALAPVLKGELKAFFHAHRADDIFTAIRISEEFGLDYVIIHGSEGYIIAKELARLNAKVIVGPVLCAREKPELKNASIRNAGIMASHAIPVAICTDHPELPIEYLTLSAAISVREGMPRRLALESITTTAARICGIDDRVGSLSIGKDADILIFDNDPLLLDSKPKAVYVNGINRLAQG